MKSRSVKDKDNQGLYRPNHLKLSGHELDMSSDFSKQRRNPVKLDKIKTINMIYIQYNVNIYYVKLFS